ncbi:unnamed protein product [Rotaria socialis]
MGQFTSSSSTSTSFYRKIKITLALFFLREQQLLLFFQDATHLATKWCNRLLSSTAELRLGDQSISINPLYSIIDNGKFTKIDHCLAKFDMNPKYRQNFRACLNGNCNKPLEAFMKGAVAYKHRHDHQSLATQSQGEIDLIDAEQIINEAYHEAIDMLNGLKIFNLLNDKNVLGLKPLSDQTDDGEFEIADDDNDDDNRTAADLNSNDGFSSNDDEQDDTRNLINTTKEEFSEMKVFNMVQSHIEHSYFKATINDEIKYIHKQTACWLLTGEKSKMLIDRLLRVQQINKKS